MPHAAKEVSILRKRIKGLSKNLEKKWFLFIFSHPRHSRERREKHPHGNEMISNKNFKIKLDIFLREPILL